MENEIKQPTISVISDNSKSVISNNIHDQIFKTNYINIPAVENCNFKELKDLIDSKTESYNKPYILLIKKRVRQAEDSQDEIIIKTIKEPRKKEKFLDKFDKMSLTNVKFDSEGNPVVSTDLTEESKKEKSINKDDLLHNIMKFRKIKIFSKNSEEPKIKEGKTRFNCKMIVI